jgi:hypothetical protein
MLAFRGRGGKVDAMVGIDLRQTSKEALELLLTLCDNVYVTYEPRAQSCIFHPKIYLFDGKSAAKALIGSHNLTSGGIETNYESGAAFHFAFDVDKDLWLTEFEPLWSELLPPDHVNTLKLDRSLLAQLVDAQLVLSEDQIRSIQRQATAPGHRGTLSLPFGGVLVKPPTPLSSAIPKTAGVGGAIQTLPAPSSLATILVMQIKPHHNAEMFLSKKALDQNNAFFSWPWTGRTRPKKTSNQGYPQRDPTPVMLIRVYDIADSVIFEKRISTLMVFYETKSEVRVTIGQEARRVITDYSILVLRKADGTAPDFVDYYADIYPPSSPRYQTYLAGCDQTLLGGGGRSRMMGWL